MEVQVKLLYQCFGILELHLTWFSCGLHGLVGIHAIREPPIIMPAMTALCMKSGEWLS